MPSLEETVCPPTPADEGTIKVAENPPVELDMIEAGLVVIADPSKVTVIAWFGVNAFALRVTVVPEGPDAGLINRVVTRYTATSWVFEFRVIARGSTDVPVSSQ